MTLNGIEYDDVQFPVPPRMCGQYEEGKRTKVKYIWIERWEKISPTGMAYISEMLTFTNYGSATIDGKPIRNDEDLKKIKELFGKMEMKC